MCFFVVLLIGTRSGYLASCKAIVGAARTIARVIRDEIPELYVLGEPPASVVAFGAAPNGGANVMEVGDLMSSRGWHLNALKNPAALHIACTVRLFCLLFRSIPCILDLEFWAFRLWSVANLVLFPFAPHLVSVVNLAHESIGTGYLACLR